MGLDSIQIGTSMSHDEASIVAKLHHVYRHVSFRPADFLPGSVYHYTSAAGLYGIIQSGILRGSNFAYLNDASGIRYGEAGVQERFWKEPGNAHGDGKRG